MLKVPSLLQIYICKNQIGYYIVATAHNEVLEGSINPDCVDSLRAVPADDVTLGSTR
jgi:hypothetical protein